jgi:hypothetical protein
VPLVRRAQQAVTRPSRHPRRGYQRAGVGVAQRISSFCIRGRVEVVAPTARPGDLTFQTSFADLQKAAQNDEPGGQRRETENKLSRASILALNVVQALAISCGA